MNVEGIHIIRGSDKAWVLMLNGAYVGKSKMNCDCVLAAKRLQNLFQNPPPIVNEANASGD